MTSPTLPEGFRIERHEGSGRIVTFSVFEVDGPTWTDGSPRSSIDVELWPADIAYGAPRGPRLSWPSTSDKRPVLAQALAAALVMAAEEAQS